MPSREYCAPPMVLRGDCPEDQVTALAERLGLEVLDDVAGKDGVLRDIVWHAGQRVLLEYLAESRVGCAVAIVRGSPEGFVRQLAAVVEFELKPWSMKELIASVDEATGPAGRAVALIRLGMGAPRDHCPGKIYRRIKTALLKDPEDDVRVAALWAAHYTGWPKFISAFEQVADEDQERGTLHHHAAVILATLGRR